MKHIAIEGMDGVGKTTVCQLLKERIGYAFVTKPLHYLTDVDNNDWPNYFKARDIANRSNNHDFSAWFYGLGNIYTYELFKDQNIITDRHIVSNYCWSGGPSNMDIFNLIIKKIGKPTLTVILYASSEIIKNRLLNRDNDDHDLKKIAHSEAAYEKMISFCELKHFPYMVINTDTLTPEEIVNRIIEVFNNGIL